MSAGDRTDLGDDTFVEYSGGFIVLEQDSGMGGTVYLDASTLARFDEWRKALDDDIALRQEAGF